MADIDTGDLATAEPPVSRRGPGRPPKQPASASAADMVRILIPKTKDQTRDVFVSVQFKPYLIKRGEPVEVPRHVATALELAVQTEYEPRVDPITGRKEMVPQQTMSVPFQYV